MKEVAKYLQKYLLLKIILWKILRCVEAFSLWPKEQHYLQVDEPRKAVCGVTAEILLMQLSFLRDKMENAHLINAGPGVIHMCAPVEQCPQEICAEAKSMGMISDCHPQ